MITGGWNWRASIIQQDPCQVEDAKKENKMIPGGWIGRKMPAIFNRYWPCQRHFAGRDDSLWMKCSGGASGITRQYTKYNV